MLRYVEPLSEARTKLADFFSILLEVLSDPTGNITAHCVGIWLHRVGVAQNRNIAGADCPE